MYHDLIDLWKNLLRTGLKEDGWPWDWTTLGTQRSLKIPAHIIAKAEGLWAGEGLVLALNQLGKEIGSDLEARSQVSDGTRLKPGDRVLEMIGNTQALLAFERPFLNLAAYVSGIATSTRRIVEIVQKACPKNSPRVTLTRKTLPHYRDIAIHGVRVGGGFPHRVSLSGGVLIKENHIAAAGGISNAIQGVRGVAPHGLKVEVEVRSLAELKEALTAQAEGVLLDNFSPEEVRSALKVMKNLAPRPFVEVSGGLSESTISAYAIEGVDVLSVGALTHSVKALDLSFLVNSLGAS